MKILRYIKDFYTGVGAMLFTLATAVPALLVAAFVLGWVVKLVVKAFKLGWL